MQHITIDTELAERIALNEKRLCDPYYQMPQVFSPPEYRSYGDKEGRVLFAFLCHLKMTGKENPALRPMLAALPERTNEKGFFGPIHTGINGDALVDEFQFGSSTWYLRALCEAERVLGSDCIPGTTPLALAKRVFEGLYLPALGHFKSYPTQPHNSLTGDMLGSELRENEWILCSDIGAAFLAVDGLADYYLATQDSRAYALLCEMESCFDKIDKLKIRAQTHATLTAARGFLRLYEHTGAQQFWDTAQNFWQLYQGHGMTATYQNFNWFSREDSWTEPCAIVDSLILALHFYRLCKRQQDLTLARRIWHNGLASGQRSNGGAGTDTCVTAFAPLLQAGDIYEAYFCCTMRLSEGLLWAQRYADLLAIDVPDVPQRDASGRYFAGDLLFGEVQDGASEQPFLKVDGHSLAPILKYYRLPEERAKALKTKIVFS